MLWALLLIGCGRAPVDGRDADPVEDPVDRAARALAEHPGDVLRMLQLADAQLEHGRYDEALETTQRALDARPGLSTYIRGAHLRWLHGDLEGAVALAASAIRAGGPALPEATAFCYVDLGTLQLRAGRPELARQAAQAAMGLVPGYAPARSALAEALAMEGRPDAAIEVLEALVDEQPRVRDRLRLAELLEDAGHVGEAAVQTALAEASAEADPHALARHLARHDRDPERALALAREAARRPTVAHLDTLALALLRAGHVDEARGVGDRALSRGTADARLHLHRGLIAAASGHGTEAADHLQQAQTLNPLADPRLMRELTAALDPGAP